MAVATNADDVDDVSEQDRSAATEVKIVCELAPDTFAVSAVGTSSTSESCSYR